jgi:CheY-like chemotaxis protein
MELAGQRVLIVEDEGIVAMVVEDYLEDLGCTVVAIAARLEEGEEAARCKVIDVAILDINLAGKVSYPIAAILRGRGIPFLFATGYGAAGLPVGLRGVPVLAKPFRISDLASALAAAHVFGSAHRRAGA